MTWEPPDPVTVFAVALLTSRKIIAAYINSVLCVLLQFRCLYLAETLLTVVLMAHILTINVSLISIIEQTINIVNSIKYMYVHVQSCICQDYNEVVDM